MDNQRTNRESGVKQAFVRTLLGVSLCVILGSLIFAFGIYLLRTNVGKGNQIPGGVAWSVVGAAIVLGTIAKTYFVLHAES